MQFVRYAFWRGSYKSSRRLQPVHKKMFVAKCYFVNKDVSTIFVDTLQEVNRMTNECCVVWNLSCLSKYESIYKILYEMCGVEVKNSETFLVSFTME